MRIKTLAWAAALTAVAVSATAKDRQDQRPSPVVAAVLRCRAIPEVEKRAACFDASVAVFADAIDKRSVVVLDREEVQATRRSLFGFSLPRLSLFGGHDDDGAARQEEVKEVSSTIKQLGSFGYGLWSITLAEGGTWRTMEANRNFFPKVGQTIVIKRGGFGNYLASIPGELAMRVSRIG